MHEGTINLREVLNMDRTWKKSFARSMDSLDLLFAFMTAFISENRIDESVAYSIMLAIEEVFTNLVKYDPSAELEIPVDLNIINGRIVVRLVNINGKDFDITATEEVDISAPLQKRPIGGLGLHLAKHFVDELLYNNSRGVSTITIVKALEE